MPSRSTGSTTSRTDWASSIFRRRFDATRSASIPGLLMFSMTMEISEGRFFRLRIFSIFSFTDLMSASVSRVISLTSGSGIFLIRTIMWDFTGEYLLISPFTMPWIKIFILPSGSFSIRIIIATVPKL